MKHIRKYNENNPWDFSSIIEQTIDILETQLETYEETLEYNKSKNLTSEQEHDEGYIEALNFAIELIKKKSTEE